MFRPRPRARRLPRTFTEFTNFQGPATPKLRHALDACLRSSERAVATAAARARQHAAHPQMPLPAVAMEPLARARGSARFYAAIAIVAAVVATLAALLLHRLLAAVPWFPLALLGVWLNAARLRHREGRLPLDADEQAALRASVAGQQEICTLLVAARKQGRVLLRRDWEDLSRWSSAVDEAARWRALAPRFAVAGPRVWRR